jgi:hypothetical protein
MIDSLVRSTFVLLSHLPALRRLSAWSRTLDGNSDAAIALVRFSSSSPYYGASSRHEQNTIAGEDEDKHNDSSVDDTGLFR